MKVHEEADMRAVCDAIVREEGEAGLSGREILLEGLKSLAEERGLGRVGVSNKVAQTFLNAYRNELRAARQRGSDAAAGEVGEIILPEGLAASLAEHVRTVEGIVRKSHAEVLRQADLSTQSRLRQMEAEAAHAVANLESALQEAQKEGLDTAGELDEAEGMLALARSQIQELSALAQSKSEALEKLEAESRANLATARAALESAFEARTRAEEQAHRCELARVSGADVLEHTRQELARVRRERDERLAVSERAESRARDAERLLDVNRGVLATVQEERRVLGLQLERALTKRQPKAATRSQAARPSAKAE